MSAIPGVPVILDAKRGDIGSTAQHYAIEAFDRYGADAVTVNPYLGRDSVQPFLDRADKGVIILCRTSNPGARDLQDLVMCGRPRRCTSTSPKPSRATGTATATARWWSARPGRESWRDVRAHRRRPAAAGARRRRAGRRCRGGGAQRQDRRRRRACMISSSRAILYAGNGEDFADAARAAAQALRDEINRYR